MNQQIEANIRRLDAVIAQHRQANKTMDDEIIQFLRDQLVCVVAVHGDVVHVAEGRLKRPTWRVAELRHDAALFSLSHSEEPMNTTFNWHAQDMLITPEIDADRPSLTLRIHQPRQDPVLSCADLHFYTKSLDQILDLGYAIVNAVNKIKHGEESTGTGLHVPPGDPYANMRCDPDIACNRPGYTTIAEVEGVASDTGVECGKGWSFAGQVCGECGKPATHKAHQQFLCKEHFDLIPF